MTEQDVSRSGLPQEPGSPGEEASASSAGTPESPSHRGKRYLQSPYSPNWIWCWDEETKDAWWVDAAFNLDERSLLTPDDFIIRNFINITDQVLFEALLNVPEGL